MTAIKRITYKIYDEAILILYHLRETEKTVNGNKADKNAVKYEQIDNSNNFALRDESYDVAVLQVSFYDANWVQ